MIAQKSLLKRFRQIECKTRINKKKQWTYKHKYFSTTSEQNLSTFSSFSVGKSLSFITLGSLSALSLLFWNEKSNNCLALAIKDEPEYEELKKLYNEYLTNGQEEVADFYLALMYLKEGKDIKKAIELFIKAFEYGIPEAGSNLGVLYVEGIAIKKDIKKGIYYLEAADKIGLPDASRNLAHIYYSGKEVRQDIEKARSYYKKAADKGDPDSQHMYGMLCYLGKGGPRDLDNAIRYQTLAAESGIAEAQYNIALLHHQGLGTKQDLKKAYFWYEKSAKQNFSEAQYRFSRFLRDEPGYKSHMKEAIHWLELSSKNGNVLAQREYGAYLKAHDKLEDAYSLFTKCGKAGNNDCKVEQALMIIEGKGVPSSHSKDFKLAFNNIKEAADDGFTIAQTKLAAMYLMGVGTKVDLDKAIYYFGLAAKQNDKDALFHLGLMYEQGYGVQKSSLISKEYLQKSADLGHEMALSYLNNPEDVNIYS